MLCAYLQMHIFVSELYFAHLSDNNNAWNGKFSTTLWIPRIARAVSSCALLLSIAITEAILLVLQPLKGKLIQH